MTSITIAAAQTISSAGNIAANVARHLRAMQVAAQHGVHFLVFPELSLTGYEQAMARELAILPDDVRLDPLREAAQRLAMVTVVGAPLRAADREGVFIGALVLGGDGQAGVYAKQYLHPGEETVFTPGAGGLAVPVRGKQVGLAVCADYTHPVHAAQAAGAGADIYAAGALVTEKGYAREAEQLAGYAAAHGMTVLLANHGGPTGGWQPVGRSAVWAEDGRQVIAAPGPGECLVMASHDSRRWTGALIAV